MRQKQQESEEKVVYLSCPCAERLREIKAVLQQAGFEVLYALEMPLEGVTVVHTFCPLTEQDRQILQAILNTGSIKVAAAQLGLSHQHRPQTFAPNGFGLRCPLYPTTHRHRPSKRLHPIGRQCPL